MKIAIVGGTGTLGSLVAAELNRRGNDVRVLSRNSPGYQVDLTTGDGLEEPGWVIMSACRSSAASRFRWAISRPRRSRKK
jgi:nucleoside-diphosphate-sugar epimerase